MLHRIRPEQPVKQIILIFALLFAPLARAQSDGLATFIDTYAQAHRFNGEILVQKPGQPLLVQSFGLANIALKVPNARQTRFKIASITKLFTSVLIMQLYEQGKLDLDRPFKAYLPGYTGPAADQVTIHQLLDHTSGLPNIDNVKDAADAIAHGLPVYQTPYTSDQLLSKFCSSALVNVPGKVFDYNNADYIVLGKIIEHIEGQPFDQVLKTRILQPLQLKNTGMLRQSEIVDGLADTYFYRDDLKMLANDLPVYPENWYAAGAMYSTADDLLGFTNALFGLKLIKQTTLDAMLKPGLDDYAFGVWSYETKVNGKAHPVMKRPGRIMGAQTQLFHVRDQNITIVILSNTGTTDLDEFVAAIAKRAID
jgi:CubicO group peptidase (beta-lactamase class C family)